MAVTWSVPLPGARAEPASTTAPSTDALVADPFAAETAEASRRFGMPARWITAVIHAESSGDVQALSPKGAIGLMQIMPETYASLRARYGLGADPMVPRDNILAGAAFLRELYDRYGMPGFLAAYNAGPARYEEHLATGRPLPAETRRYVAILAPMVGGELVDRTVIVAADAYSWTRAPLFIALGDKQSGNNGVASDAQPDRPTWRRATADLSALAPQSDGLFVPRQSGDRRQ
jgi:soluble lytic murein transglycosylase-like protein